LIFLANCLLMQYFKIGAASVA